MDTVATIEPTFLGVSIETLGKQYDDLSLRERFATIRAGLRSCATERERKLARRELARFRAAGAAAVAVLLFFGALLLLRTRPPVPLAATVPVEIIEPDPPEILDAKWFTYDEILAMQDELRSADLITNAISAVKHGKTAPLDIIDVIK